MDRPIDIPSIMRAGGFEEGVKAERAKIVEWLRSFEIVRGGTRGAEEDAEDEALLMVTADAIERGDHMGSKA